MRDADGLPQLGQEGAGTQDGAGQEGGEEADEEGEVRERTRGRHLASVHVDDVAHGLEGEEGNADEQGQVQVGSGGQQAEARQGVEREVGVFEESQLAQHEAHCQPQPAFAPACGFGLLHADGAEEVDERDDGQQHTPGTGVLIIEIVGKGRDVEKAQCCRAPAREEGVAGHEGQEEEKEEPGVEQQGFGGRIEQGG